jgi:aryl-alcohol dehydrogenase-like predicted oxidoreductase
MNAPLGTRRLGATDIEITPIGLGCMQFATRGMTSALYADVGGQEEITAIVKTALSGGITWFDTAEMYGRGESERALTTALRQCGVSPGDVRIATKWLPGFRTARSIRRTIGDRVAALQGFPIDLHQIHSPASLSPIAKQMREMARLVRDGTIASVGVSNFSAQQMAKAYDALKAEGIPLASNQVQRDQPAASCHRDERRPGHGTPPRHHAHRLQPFAIGTVDRTVPRRPEAGHVAVPRTSRLWLVRSQDPDPNRAAHRRASGDRKGVTTPGQVALNWLVTYYGETVVAIPGASKPRQAEENAGAMGFCLTAKEVERLDELSRRCGALSAR